MKRMALALISFFSITSVVAQDGSFVSGHLKNYEVAKTDSAKAYHLYWVAFHMSHDNAEEGIKWGRRGLEFALKCNNRKLAGDNHNSIGYCFDTSGNADSAMVHYNQSIEALEAGGNHCETASVYANIGTTKKRRNDLKGALESFLKSREIQSGCNDIGYHGSTLYSIGTCYNAMDNFEKALEYFKFSLTIEQEKKNLSKECIVRNGMANAYKGQGEYERAETEFRKALECYMVTGNTYSSGYAYEGLAELMAAQQKLDSAIFYCTKAREIFIELKVNFDIVYETTLLAGYLKSQNKFAEAEKLLLEALPLSAAEKLDYDRQTILSELADITRKKGDFKKAYEYLFESTTLRDSLKIDEQKSELAQLAGKYETEKRDKQIALQEAENQKQKQQKYFFLGGAVLFLLLALVLINRYVHKQRTTKELAAKNILIEKEKDRAERSEAVKQQFLANMSHEIRTPMNAITGLSRLLLDRKHDTQTSEYLHAIQHSSENLLVILNDILDISKMDAGKMKLENIAFDLRDELKNIEQIFSARTKTKGIDFRIAVDEAIPPFITGDPSRLTQVLNNLVSNAVKFTEKGSVQLAVCKSQIANENPEVRHLQTAISQLQFSITDTGIGIPKEKLHTVFESFSQANASDTRRFGGTGLGLTIARNLVRLMGGDLEVESQEGRGSTFSFSLPLQTATKEAAQKNNVPLSRSSSIKFHVLVAEDNDYNFLVTRDTLKKYFLNANIIHVKNGKEAVDALQEDDYDLVLMDIQMPVMDGYEATNEIRKQNFEVQILGLTASVIRSDLDKCIAAGMNGYIAKPFRDEEFVSAVLKAIGQNGIIEVSGEVNIPKQKKLFLEMIPKRLKEMKSAMRDNRFADLKKVIHQIRPQLMKMNMQDIEPQCIETENTMDMNARVNNNVSQIILAIESKLDDLAKEKTESDH